MSESGSATNPTTILLDASDTLDDVAAVRRAAGRDTEGTDDA